MNAFELVASLTLDKSDYDKGLNSAESEGQSAGNGIGKAIGSAMKVASGAVVAATGAAATAVGAITKQAVDAYSEYEQLAGGAAKIFDELDQSEILNDASNAWKNLNMSTNEYLTAINQTGAMFSQTMGDEKGYETAKRGMQAISDYATGTGRDISELNDKFSMITRSTTSYQSIADQFAGILPATSKDFLEQAQAAGFLSDQYNELTDIPIAEYQQAVASMLEKGTSELGLAGNTAKEALTTISGSLLATQSAWENVKAAIAGGGDLKGAFDGLVTALFGEEKGEGLVNQIIPRIQTAMEGVGDFIKESAPLIADKLPELLESILPSLTESTVEMLSAFASVLPDLIGVVLDEIPNLVKQITDKLAEEFPEFEEIFTGISDMVSGVFDFVEEHGDEVVTVAGSVLGAFMAFEALTSVSTAITTAKKALEAFKKAQEADTIAQAALNAVMNANPFMIIITIIGALVGAFITLWLTNEDFRNKVKEIWSNVVNFFKSSIEKIKEKIEEFKAKFKEIGDKIKELFDFGARAKEWGKDLIDNFINGIKEKWEALKKTVSDVAQSVKDFLGFSEPKLGPLSNFHTYAPDMMDLFAKGIKDNAKKVTGAIEDNIVLPTTKGVKGSITNAEDNGIIDYSEMANAVILAFEKSGLTVEMDNREFGRIVRKVVTV